MWAREQVKLHKGSDPLWTHVGLIIAQMDGLHAGLADWAKTKGKKVFLLSLFDLCLVRVFCLLGTPVSPRGLLSVVHLLFSPQPLSMFDIQFLNAVGDLLDLIPALVPSPGRLLRPRQPRMGLCSALIKVRGPNSPAHSHTGAVSGQRRSCCMTTFLMLHSQNYSCVFLFDCFFPIFFPIVDKTRHGNGFVALHPPYLTEQFHQISPGALLYCLFREP